MRVLFGNNYPMTEARRLCEAGVYPRQHLWGASHLEAASLTVEYLPFEPSTAIRRLSGRLRWSLGDLGQEREAIRSADSETVCYAADQNSFKGLAALRRLHGFRWPLVVVVHHEPWNRWEDWVLSGVDVVLCLSARVADRVRRVVRGARRRPEVKTLPWGPALDFAGYSSTGEGFVISAGKSNRDISILLRALEGLDLKARIYAPGRFAEPRSNIEIVNLDLGSHKMPGVSHWTFEEAIADIAAASIIAIPLEDPNRLSGLSELNDALALAKPVVMTRSPYIDVDIEAIGCGIWIEPGDADGWTRALRELAADEDRRHEMGRAGRRFAEERWNADAFGRGVVDAIRLASAG